MPGNFRLAEWLYEVLLYLYPKPFRETYGQQMRLTFRDACRNAYQRNGSGGLFALWFPTLLDLFKSVFEAWVQQGEITMMKERLIGLAGPLTLLVGVIWVVASVGELVLWTGLGSSDTFWDVFWLICLFFSFIPLPLALIGTLLRFHSSADMTGRVGLRLSIAGCLSVIVFVVALMLFGGIAPEVEQGPWSTYVVGSCFLCLFIGYMLFGVTTLRYRLLPRWNFVPLLIGLPLLIHPLSDWYNVPPYSPTSFAVSFIYLATTGVCWILIGMAMMEQGRETQPTPAL